MKLSVLDQNREEWKQLVKEIVKAGEASSSVDGEATLLHQSKCSPVTLNVLNPFVFKVNSTILSVNNYV